jgi:hypothetical protein
MTASIAGIESTLKLRLKVATKVPARAPSSAKVGHTIVRNVYLMLQTMKTLIAFQGSF